MQGANVAYLLRYLVVVMSFMATILMLRQALKDFRGGIRHQVQPTFGFCLVATQHRSDRHDRHRYLPLYHTTMIGCHRQCDIRLKQDSILPRHATIYLYDGDWYIQPLKSSAKVAINGIDIQSATLLENKDQIQFGDVSLVFLSEAETGIRISEQYVRRQYYENPLMFVRPPRSPWAFAFYQFFYGILMVAIYAQLQGDLVVLRKPAILILAAFLLIFNIYYLMMTRIFKYYDRLAWLATMMVAAIGLFIQMRLTILRPSVMSETIAEKGGHVISAMISLLMPQYMALALGLILLPIIMIVACRTRFLEFMFHLCLVLTPLLLIVTLVIGHGDQTHGATLWIRVGGMSLQLTEFAKMTYVIVLATFFKNRPRFRTQLLFAVWAGSMMFLIMLLPDLGSIMILLPTTLVVYVVMTSEYLTTLAILGSGTVLGFIAWTLFPHVRSRLSGWTTLWQEVNDGNRQIVYGLQAMARGGLLGRGLGNGSPDGIPVVASDMVFTVLCEDLGLIVGLCVVICFIVVWLRGAKNMLLVKDGFSSSLTLAIGTMFFFESAIVIAGCTGLIPLTGVTLPFISQGGSSILAKTLMMGVLLGLMARRTEMVVRR